MELPDPNGTHCIAIGVANGVGENAGKILLSGLHEKATVVRLYWGTNAAGIGNGGWTDAGAYAGFPSADLRGGAFNNSRNSTPNERVGRHWGLGGPAPREPVAGPLPSAPTRPWVGTE